MCWHNHYLVLTSTKSFYCWDGISTIVIKISCPGRRWTIDGCHATERPITRGCLLRWRNVDRGDVQERAAVVRVKLKTLETRMRRRKDRLLHRLRGFLTPTTLSTCPSTKHSRPSTCSISGGEKLSRRKFMSS